MNDVLDTADGDSLTPNSCDWRDVIRAASPKQVAQAVTMASSQPVPRAWQDSPLGRHITRLKLGQQSSLIQMVIWELEREGVDRQTISRQTFVRQLDPDRMSPQEINTLIDGAGQSYPQVLARIAARYHEQPEMLEGLLGERILAAVVNSLGGTGPRKGMPSAL